MDNDTPRVSVYPGNVVGAQIALAVLNRSHKGPVDATFVGKSFLRVPLSSQFSYPLPQSTQEQICSLTVFALNRREVKTPSPK